MARGHLNAFGLRVFRQKFLGNKATEFEEIGAFKVHRFALNEILH